MSAPKWNIFIYFQELINPESQTGLVFRENKFTASPSLPFGSLAMPAFEKLDPEAEYIDIDKNHFVCECSKLSWFIGAMTHQFDKEAIQDIGNDDLGYGSLDFLELIYETSGHCLDCQLTTCEVTEKDFMKYADSALIVHDNELKCSISGQALKSHSKNGKSSFIIPERPSSYSYEREHENDSSPDIPSPPDNLNLKRDGDQSTVSEVTGSGATYQISLMGLTSCLVFRTLLVWRAILSYTHK